MREWPQLVPSKCALASNSFLPLQFAQGRTTYECRFQPFPARHELAVQFLPHALTSWHDRCARIAPLGCPRTLEHRTCAVGLVSPLWVRIVRSVSPTSAGICVAMMHCAQYRIEVVQNRVGLCVRTLYSAGKLADSMHDTKTPGLRCVAAGVMNIADGLRNTGEFGEPPKYHL